jgi:DNA (cytosine-5)-methyltransferase 1
MPGKPKEFREVRPRERSPNCSNIMLSYDLWKFCAPIGVLFRMATQLELLQPLTAPVKLLEELPPVISFFSGAGFLDLGLVRAGFQIAWSLEKDPKFCLAHDHGFNSYFKSIGQSATPPSINCVDDIQHKGPNAIKREAFGLSAPSDAFGIVGGPPCPDFSVGGKNRGQLGDRGRLTRVFVERISDLGELFARFALLPSTV